MAAMSEIPAAALLDDLARRGARDVVVALCDISGQLRGKTLAREKFLAAAGSGSRFPPIFPVTDFADSVWPVAAGAALARLGDGQVRVVPDTGRLLPWHGEVPAALFLAEMIGPEADLDPRVCHGAVLARAAARGVVPVAAVEFEFTLLDVPPRVAAARRYRDLEPAGAQSALYGVWRPLAAAEYWRSLRGALEIAGIPVETLHGEFGAGCHEITIAAAPGIIAADHAVLLREMVKAHAARHGQLATFMARWSGTAPGHSGHVHLSLRDGDGRALFDTDPAALRHFIGGLQHHLPELVLLLLPNVNSYRRLSAGAWSFDPRWCLWGEDNRTAALRVLRDPGRGTHVEIRIPGADANPHLSLAAVLGAGLHGMERRIEPTAPVTGNAAESGGWPDALRLPQTLLEAIDRFETSPLAADLLGTEFRRVFAQTRRAQEREARDAVSEWELQRFLE